MTPPLPTVAAETAGGAQGDVSLQKAGALSAAMERICALYAEVDGDNWDVPSGATAFNTAAWAAFRANPTQTP